MPNKTILLIDGNSLAYRAFFALPPLSNSRGEPVNAVYGFTTMLLKVIEEAKPDYIASAFDLGPSTIRQEKYPEYKAHREKVPDTLPPQMKKIHQLMERMGIPVYYQSGYEADDCLGTLAKLGEKAGLDVLILSGDLDMLQLVSHRINVLTSRKGVSQVIRYTPEQVRQRYNLTPEQVLDMKTLIGDTSDNVPGLPGVGEITAQKLLGKYHTLEGIWEHCEELTPKIQQALSENRERLQLGRELLAIKTDLPLDLNLTALSFKGLSNPGVQDFFRELEFKLAFKETPVEPLRQEFKYLELNDKNLVDFLRILKKAEKAAFCLYRVKDEVKGLSIALNEKQVYFLPLKPAMQDTLFGDCAEEERLKDVMEELYRLPKLVGFDLKAGLGYLKEIPSGCQNWFDVKLADYLLSPEDNLALPEIIRRWLKISGLELQPQTPEQIPQAACRQAFELLNLHPLLTEALVKEQMEDLYYKLELPLILVLYRMEKYGVKLDLAYLQELSLHLQHELEELEAKAYQVCGEKFNLNSPKQVAEVLFEKLKLAPQGKTKTGFSTGVEVLQELKDQHPVVELLLSYREYAKLKSTYVDAFPRLVADDRRLHTSFNQTVTATGRLSSSDPNLQNIPIRTELGREIRRAFIAQPGMVLLAGDYSQIELRVMAHLSQDPQLIKAFSQGEDIHRLTAAKIFAVEPAEVTFEMRRKAKEINFGIIYGMGPHGLAQRVNLTRKEAKEFIDRYFENFAGVKEFIDQLLAEARNTQMVQTILGRKRNLPLVNSHNYVLRSQAERMAVNTPIQGSAADLIKLAMLKIDETLRESYSPDKVRMLLQIHDELIFEVKQEFCDQVKNLVRNIMEGVYQISVPLVVDINIGNNWAEMK